MKAMQRYNKGSMLAEATAALALLFPLVIIAVFVTIEASKAYMIGRAMNEGAELAAKALGAAYHNDPTCNSDGTQTQIFSSIRIPNMINSNNQFTITQWNTIPSPATNPKSVTVQVQYLSGQGSPKLPQFPDPNPLNTTLTIVGQATYALQ